MMFPFSTCSQHCTSNARQDSADRRYSEGRPSIFSPVNAGCHSRGGSQNGWFTMEHPSINGWFRGIPIFKKPPRKPPKWVFQWEPCWLDRESDCILLVGFDGCPSSKSTLQSKSTAQSKVQGGAPQLCLLICTLFELYPENPNGSLDPYRT